MRNTKNAIQDDRVRANKRATDMDMIRIVNPIVRGLIISHVMDAAVVRVASIRRIVML